jgi:hypothetical protein
MQQTGSQEQPVVFPRAVEADVLLLLSADPRIDSADEKIVGGDVQDVDPSRRL